jgi:hypothetical protein
MYSFGKVPSIPLPNKTERKSPMLPSGFNLLSPLAFGGSTISEVYNA